MLPSGKPDYQTVRDLARASNTDEPNVIGLRELFADVLQIDADSIDPDASFVDLGGNSLSYVTMSVRLERALGQLPADWQRAAAARAGSACRSRRAGRGRGGVRRWRPASHCAPSAIVFIVGSHAGLFELWGGAHLLLGIAGYNFGRFCLTPVPRADRVRHLRNTIGVDRGAVGDLGRDRAGAHRRLHADESAAGQQVPRPARQHDRRTAVVRRGAGVDSGRAGRCCAGCRPWTGWNGGGRSPFAAAFLAVGLALRYDILGLHLGRDAWFTVLAFWFFAVGWAAAKASTTLQRAAVTVVLIVGLHGYFDSTLREVLVLAGLALLIWLPALRCPPALTVVAGIIAEASLYTYLTHYQVYALFDGHPLLGVIASIVVGVLLTYVWSNACSRTRHPRRRLGYAMRLRLRHRRFPLCDEPFLRHAWPRWRRRRGPDWR